MTKIWQNEEMPGLDRIRLERTTPPLIVMTRLSEFSGNSKTSKVR